MFTRKEQDPTPVLTPEQNRLIALLADTDPMSTDYARIMVHLSSLNDLIPLKQGRGKLSIETIAMIAANLGGLVLVLNYERAAVLSSKAASMLFKLKS